MARRTRIDGPPTTITDYATYDYLQKIADELNKFPNTSIESYTGGPDSNHTGNPGDLVVNIAGEEGSLYIKESGNATTTVWKSVGGTRGYGFFASDSPGPTELSVTNGVVTALDNWEQTSAYGSVEIETVSGDDFFKTTSAGTHLVAFNSSFTADAGATWTFNLYERSGTSKCAGCTQTGSVPTVQTTGFGPIPLYFEANAYYNIRVAHDLGSAQGISITDAIFSIQEI